MLVLQDVHTYYGKSHVLHGVSLEVGAGEVVGLLGRNGVGKSTTLKTVMGLVRPAAGRIDFEGQPVAGLPPYRLARMGIGYVPEDRRIFRLLTVLENLRTGLDRTGVDDRRRDALLDKVYASFPVLRDRRDQAGGTLSGGEQQMLAIARAMMLEPRSSSSTSRPRGSCPAWWRRSGRSSGSSIARAPPSSSSSRTCRSPSRSRTAST
jgi:branched-chain amino acid transport system ATP-binding protein